MQFTGSAQVVAHGVNGPLEHERIPFRYERIKITFWLHYLPAEWIRAVGVALELFGCRDTRVND